CRLGLVLPVYTWTLVDSLLTPEGCVGSLGHRLVDQGFERSPHIGVNFWFLVELQLLGVCCNVLKGVAYPRLKDLYLVGLRG
ncbi:hypothetical protein BHE74_00041443, partial [Ensete ventricosum]